jgi:acyl-coenzyme A thioesterase PaaI-like protein
MFMCASTPYHARAGTSLDQSSVAFQKARRIVAGLRATDLAYNRALGIRDAAPGAEHLLELPFGPLVQNHLGTLHAAAQFSLAEAASAECLQRCYGGVEVKYRKPAAGDLLAYGAPNEPTRLHLLAEMAARGRGKAVILIDLKDRSGTLTFHGQFEWFISRLPPPQL